MSKPDIATPVMATTMGGLAGGIAVSNAGYTAAGMVGGGAGIGAAAGPVGVVFGSLAGLALYAMTRVIGDQIDELNSVLAAQARAQARAQVRAQAKRSWRGECPSCGELAFCSARFPTVMHCSNPHCAFYDGPVCQYCGGPADGPYGLCYTPWCLFEARS